MNRGGEVQYVQNRKETKKARNCRCSILATRDTCSLCKKVNQLLAAR